jgi:large subunit ribosomal protein L21
MAENVMYAVIATGGKQYRVSQGDIIDVEKLGVEVGAEVKFDQVLLIGTDTETTIGKPTVPGALVVGKVVQNGRAAKIIVFKIRRRKNYRRKQGHRQAYTRLVIQGIQVG